MQLESGAPVSALEALCAGAELVGEVREPLLPLVQVIAEQRRIRLQETVLRHLGAPETTEEAETEDTEEADE